MSDPTPAWVDHLSAFLFGATVVTVTVIVGITLAIWYLNRKERK